MSTRVNLAIHHGPDDTSRDILQNIMSVVASVTSFRERPGISILSIDPNDENTLGVMVELHSRGDVQRELEHHGVVEENPYLAEPMVRLDTAAMRGSSGAAAAVAAGIPPLRHTHRRIRRSTEE